MINRIKGAIFDMDGTLVDSLMVWDVIWDSFGKMFFDGEKFCPSDDENKTVRTMILKDAMYYLHSIYNIGDSGEDLFKIANEVIEKFYANEVQLKEGVLPFLEYCHHNGIKMCIASASDMKLIKIAMQHCNLDKYFVKIFSCEEIGKGKDKPDIYLKALEYLGTDREETCVFEDSHIAIRTADKLGIKTVGIYDKYNYGHDEIKKIATVYISEGETLERLIN